MSDSRRPHWVLAGTWAIVALACLTALAGCGSSEDGEGGAQLTHAQVVKEGDVICARTSATASKELSARLKELPQGLTPKVEEDLILTVTVPAIEGMAADLAQIESRPEDEQKLKAISAAFTAAVAKIKKNPVAGIQNDPYAKASGLADTFGFIECSKY